MQSNKLDLFLSIFALKNIYGKLVIFNTISLYIRCTNKFPPFFIKSGQLLWKNGTLLFIQSIFHPIVLLAFGTNLDIILIKIHQYFKVMLLSDVQPYENVVLHMSISTKTYWWHQFLSSGGNLFVHLIVFFSLIKTLKFAQLVKALFLPGWLPWPSSTVTSFAVRYVNCSLTLFSIALKLHFA